MRESSTSTFQGRLIQTAFITDDIHASMRELTRTLGAGPWFLRERGVFPKQVYRGQPSQTALAIALGQAMADALVYEAEVANGARVGYFDTHGRLPAMIEVIEFLPATQAMFGRFRDSARDWDGIDPVRLRA